jgi:hypothetical protein
MARHEIADDGEAEPEAGAKGIAITIDLDERLEDLREVLALDASPRIAHADAHALVGGALHVEIDATTRRGELRRVDEEVCEDLREPNRIAANAGSPRTSTSPAFVVLSV